jgi:hypothetical protein
LVNEAAKSEDCELILAGLMSLGSPA